MNNDSQQELIDLFTSSTLSFFEQGGMATLLQSRNRNLGSLLKAERALPYLSILYRMLLFKREYELEPLYDDIYRSIEAVLSVEGADYDLHRFRTDMDQIADWELVSFRIERQRLRGYRDNRKRKFRYRLSEESIHFLEWLEQRFQDDIQHSGNDTRDLLGEMRGSLGELLRLLHNFHPAHDNPGEQTDISRRVLFQIFKANDLCQEITTGLADFNGRLLLFLVKRYEIDEVRQMIKEVDSYVETFLKQAHGLCLEILPLLKRLQQEKNLAKMLHCYQTMEEERLRTPHLLQTRRDANLATIPDRLQAFFADQGGLNRLLHRINSSSLHVWQKLRSHLRELERKNNRLQDIGARIQEIAQLDKSHCVPLFLDALLAQPLAKFDANFWDSYEKAEPPKPKKRMVKQSSFPRQFLSRKTPGDKPVQSMDEARLALLKEWLERILFAGEEQSSRISKGNYERFEDACKVMELAEAGLLADGKRLGTLQYALTTEDREVLLSIADCTLRCPELIVTPEKT